MRTLTLVLLASVAGLPQDFALSPQLRDLAASAPAVTGVHIIHLPSRRTASLNADEWFPLMSVYKLPIVVHALRLAEAGRLDLARRETLAAEDRRPGRSRLSERIAADGAVTLPVRELIESVVRDSDNTASDRLLRLAGGPAAVMDTLRTLGADGIDVSRYELEFAADYSGVCCLEQMRPFSLETFRAAVGAVSPAARRSAAAAYLRDRRDSATPRGIASFAARLQAGELLDASHTAWLLGQMQRMDAVAPRVGAQLPQGTPVARRPGTSAATDGITAAHNEAAIVTLPDRRGHLVVAVFLKGVTGNAAARDEVIARIGRAAFDWAVSAGR